jgi:hypothetical protein
MEHAYDALSEYFRIERAQTPAAFQEEDSTRKTQGYEGSEERADTDIPVVSCTEGGTRTGRRGEIWVDVYEALLTLTTVGAQDGFILDWMNVCKRTIISIHHQTLLLVLGLAKFRAVHVIHAGDSMCFFHRRGQSEALRKAAASAIGFDVSFDEVPGSVE